MTIQEIASWGHPGLDFDNSKAFLPGISSLVLIDMTIILLQLNCISLHKVFLFNKILFNKLEAAAFLFVLLASGKCH